MEQNYGQHRRQKTLESYPSTIRDEKESVRKVSELTDYSTYATQAQTLTSPKVNQIYLSAVILIPILKNVVGKIGKIQSPKQMSQARVSLTQAFSSSQTSQSKKI